MVYSKGMIKKIKVISSFPRLLVRFTLDTPSGNINCIVGNQAISQQVLLIPDGTKNISIAGHMNSRNQLVVEKMIYHINPSDYYKVGA